MSNIKQVIVMRTDLNMRKGKMISQGSHASMAFITKNSLIFSNGTFQNTIPLIHVEDVKKWVTGRFTKICLQCESEEHLLNLYKQAEEAGLIVSLITDAGLTEFNNVPTNTCIAIGPNKSEDIDKITGGLKLL